MARGTWLAALTVAAAVPVGATLADDSCYTAQTGRCEEPYLGPPLCAAGTDDTDCAEAYVLAESSSRPLWPYEVRYLDAQGLRLARNEIYARHGYSFNSADLNEFFSRRAWFTPTGQSVTLSAVEQANVAYIQQVEEGKVDPFAGIVWPADGPSLAPPTFWQADVVHADGRVEDGVVYGSRGRVTDRATGRVVIIRPHESALYAEAGTDIGIVVEWYLFPPVLAEPFIQGLDVTLIPIGREMLFGEEVTHVSMVWSEESMTTSTLEGEAWVTDDGIFLQVGLRGTFDECCGGTEGIVWELDYHLENIRRGRPDPALLEPPAGYSWGYAG